MHAVRSSFVVVLFFAVALSACTRDSRHVSEPSSSKEHAIRLGAALDARFVKADSESPQTLIARVRLAPEERPDGKRPPVNLALVVDTSGSMEGRAIDNARKASAFLIDQLHDGDRLAIIRFDSTAEVLVGSRELDDDSRREMKAKVGRMQARGTTDMEEGLRLGIAEVSANINPRGVNRIVLLGDGIPNEEARIPGLAQGAGSSGISITALGLGADYNESLMGAIAQLSGGKFHYVEDSSKVASFFENEVLRLDGVYARNAELEFLPGPGVVVESVIGQASTNDGRKVRLSLGDLSRTDKREVFVRFAVTGQHAGATVELCDAVLRYDAPGGERAEERIYLSARATASAEDLTKGQNSDIQTEAAFAQAAATTVQAIDLARQGQREQAIELLNRTAKDIEAFAKTHHNDKLVKEAEALRGLATDLPQPTRAQVAPAAAAPEAFEAAADRPSVATPKPALKSSGNGARLRAIHDAAIQRLQ